MPIQKPYQMPMPSIPALPQPIYQSGAQFDPYQAPARTNLINLTKPKGPELINLDDYMNQEETEEALKNLLEGNLGGEDIDEDVDDLAGAMDKLTTDPADEVEQAPKSTAKASRSKAPEDDGSRTGLKVKLMTHQIAGTKWMSQKEIGKKTQRKDTIQKGGILADDMGLGKTIQTITTIVTNPRPDVDSEIARKLKISADTKGCTLIVVPLPLLEQWKTEIEKFVEPHLNYKVYVHHGPRREKSGSSMQRNNIVITTYETLVSDRKSVV